MLSKKEDHHDGSKKVLDADAIKKRMMGHHGDKFVRFGPVVLFMGLFWYVMNHSGKAEDELATAGSSVKIKGSGPVKGIPDLSSAVAKYENCQVSWDPPPKKSTWDTKPLLFPAYPGTGYGGPSGNGGVLRPLFSGVTGLKSADKNYHASGKSLKRCQGADETAICTNSHPVTDIGPEKRTELFYRTVLMGIRNFKMAFPIEFQIKAIQYHGATGQPDEDEWRKIRDTWYTTAFEKWKSVIMAWKELNEYDIGMYVQYEALMDSERGPATLQRIASQLEAAGFTVAPKEDIPCIWFQAVKDEPAVLREFTKYIPGYTQEQIEFILNELRKLQKEVYDDKELVEILEEYYNDVRDNTPIDKPSSG